MTGPNPQPMEQCLACGCHRPELRATVVGRDPHSDVPLGRAAIVAHYCPRSPMGSGRYAVRAVPPPPLVTPVRPCPYPCPCPSCLPSWFAPSNRDVYGYRVLELICTLNCLYTPLGGGKWIPIKEAVLLGSDAPTLHMPRTGPEPHGAPAPAPVSGPGEPEGADAKGAGAGAGDGSAPAGSSSSPVTMETAVAEALLREGVPVVCVPRCLLKLLVDTGTATEQVCGSWRREVGVAWGWVGVKKRPGDGRSVVCVLSRQPPSTPRSMYLCRSHPPSCEPSSACLLPGGGPCWYPLLSWR